MVFEQSGALAIDRSVLLELSRQGFDDKLIGKLALGQDLERDWSHDHALLLQAMGSSFFALDDADKELSGGAPQFFANFISDDGPGLAALITGAVFGRAGNDLFAAGQMRGQRSPSGMTGARGFGLGHGGQRLLLVGQRGFALDL